MNNIWRYDLVSRLLHALLAILLITLIIIGIYMISIADQPGSGRYFNLHKSLGLVAAALIFIRIVWRLRHRPAPLPDTVALWQVKISRWVHYALYACMILMPVMGFLGASYDNRGIKFFGWPLPRWTNPNEDLSHLFFNIHITVAWILIALIVLHILAAFQHLFRKDGVFYRMWF